jgi:23S rRNA (cytidine1920-2'-O)/16S rRNA (cytidine1409-2'-O)-methyltransferase
MRLDQELVKRNLCESRTEAQELISQGAVFVDGIVSFKQTKSIQDTSKIEVTTRREFVSRGGEKLRGVLNHLYKNDGAIRQFCTNKTVLDVGSSTGGFTDCLLSYGVSSVDAIDVGTAQLHPKIKTDTRVISYENTDIRNFKTTKTYDIIVADLSFIPLEHVFDSMLSFAKNGTTFFILIKPQFEVGKGNTKKGIVKEESLVTEILTKYSTLAQEKGLQDIDISESSIRGGDGNQEYFLHGVLVQNS